MLNQTSKNFKEFFILEFTKELIRNTDKYRELFIKKEVKEVLSYHELEKELRKKQETKKRKGLGNIVHKKLKKEHERLAQLKREESLDEFRQPKKLLKVPKNKRQERTEFRRSLFSPGSTKPRPRRSSPPLRIPELMLPKTVRHIKPRPFPGEIDLGRLNPLIKDSLVKEIECNGPDTKVIVKGAMGKKNTAITLSKEEIDQIINNFSKAGKIPVSTGVFKVVHGRLILSAIVSEVIESRFIIKKMSAPPTNVPFRR